MSDWRRAVGGNVDLARTVCKEIVCRAKLLSEFNKLNFEEVAGFLLMRTRSWVLGGLPVSGIATKLPKTLGDLGMLKLAEGKDGEPLDKADITAALARPKIRTLQ